MDEEESKNEENSQILAFKCKTCEKIFKKNNKLQRHIKEIHENMKEFPCFLCRKTFKRASHLKRHAIIHADNPKPFRCNYENCMMCFSDKYHLQRHKKQKHMNVKFICPLCKMDFEKKIYLIKHNHRIHNLPKPYPCTFINCGRSFFKDFLLQKHLKHHLKPFSQRKKKKAEKSISTAEIKKFDLDFNFPTSNETMYDEESSGCMRNFINMFVHESKLCGNIETPDFNTDLCNSNFRFLFFLFFFGRVLFICICIFLFLFFLYIYTYRLYLIYFNLIIF